MLTPFLIALTVIQLFGCATSRRLQYPVEPLPYKHEEVEITVGGGSVKLAGTITLPHVDHPVPAVILITGSGQQDRNESTVGSRSGHKPFLIISDYLTRQGIAVFRMDDRGVGGSTGDFGASTIQDFTQDNNAAFDFLSSHPSVDSSRIGLLGHSEGSLVASMQAAGNPDIAFVVLMSGVGIHPRQLVELQTVRTMEAEGYSDKVNSTLKLQLAAFDILAVSKNDQEIKDKLTTLLLTYGYSASVVERSVKSTISANRIFLASYVPNRDIARIKCPVLAISGSLDVQAPSAENLAGIRTALINGGNNDITTVELDGHNHLLQRAKTGAISEYEKIDETISPIALSAIGEWILTKTR